MQLFKKKNNKTHEGRAVAKMNSWITHLLPLVMKLPSPYQWVETDSSAWGSTDCPWVSATPAVSSPPWVRKPWAFLGIFLILLIQRNWSILALGVWIVTLSLEDFPEGWRLLSLNSHFVPHPPSCTGEVFLLPELKWTILENLHRLPGGQSQLELSSWRRLTGRKANWEKDPALLGFSPANEVKFI